MHGTQNIGPATAGPALAPLLIGNQEDVGMVDWSTKYTYKAAVIAQHHYYILLLLNIQI